MRATAAVAIGMLCVSATHAAVCKNKKGALFVRTACKAKETAVSAEDLGVPPTTIAAKGYARVGTDGTVDATKSLNVTQANVTLNGQAGYCFHDLGFTVNSVVVTHDYGTSGFENTEASAALGDPWEDCISVPGTEVEVATSRGDSFIPYGFFIVFY